MLRRAATAAAFLVLASCAPETPKTALDPDNLTLTPTTFAKLEGWAEDDASAALSAFRRSCAVVERLPEDRPMLPQRVGGLAGEWFPACAAARRVPASNATARAFFEEWFRPYRLAVDGSERGLFTGYYEPELHGARVPSAKFGTPIYRRPDDLVLVDLGDWRSGLRGERIAGRVVDGRLMPYDSRADIAAGSLGGKATPIAWLSSPIDAFFVHIQGSGRVRLEDGSVIQIGYDGHNGHVYYPIGRYLVDKGLIDRESVSLQSIRAWLGDHPAEMQEVMNRNPSFIFFREIAGEGPIGAQGVALTAGRSLAVDRRFLPLGAPVWIDVDYADAAKRRLRRLMVAQDTGGAIRGGLRGDVFWGFGQDAEALAGPMAAKGGWVVLLPRSFRVAKAD
jgi:membrane-bound lytic murein transglycosylase A